MMAATKRLMLIDGHAMAYRAYHALPPLTGPNGEPTNATLGYANILLKAIADYTPDYVVATFDRGKTFRHEQYPEYKATRAETPADLRVQFDRIQQLTRALGVPIYERDGFEADDLLGTLARQAERAGLEVIIVTGDSDTFQLITDLTHVLVPKRNVGDVELCGPDEIKERYGLTPGQLIDYKALVGDSSDNIPGVSGVGAKTATNLLQAYGTLDGVYEHLDEVAQARFRNALDAGRDSAYMSRDLVTIRRDVDVTLDLDAGEWGRFAREDVVALLRELGLTSLLNRIPKPGTAAAEQLGLFVGQEPAPVHGPTECELVTSDDQLKALVARLSTAKVLALDTETDSVDTMRCKLVGVSLAIEAGKGYYIPVGHDERLGDERQLPWGKVRAALEPPLRRSDLLKVMHNAKFDLEVLAQAALPVEPPYFDTMLAAWLIEPSGRGIGLKEQAFQRFGVEMTPINQLIGSGSKQITMDRVRMTDAAPYAAADADMTYQLHAALLTELEREPVARRLFDELEMPLMPVLVEMEMRGMMVDTAFLTEMSGEMATQLAALEQQIYEAAGHPFNINSTKQLSEVLFEELQLPVVKRTRTGYSTDVSVLEELRKAHPIAQLLLDYRQLDKLRGTYVEALPALVNPQTGRVHTTFHQTGTSTGRLSSSDPNLQNIPVRNEQGRQIRGAFVAPPGHLLLSCDYSQVELRLLAHLSGDPEMTGAFLRDEDVHASTAAAVFGVPLAEVTYAQRSLAKAINFGLMYGMSSYGLAARTDLSVAEAEQFIAAYFGRFSGVKAYLDETIRRANETGYVETVLGRRRHFPELMAQGVNPNVKRAAERAAVNMPIQGSAADIIKIAMIRLHRLLHEQSLKSAILVQIHDELMLEVPESELETVRELVPRTMQEAYQLSVPLKVDVSVGKTWLEL
ncbi:MAG: DNA polymerase I [Chloroflexi bacterium]|nr:DNA polymerase I [Chloroflexota bacterium]